MTYYYDHFGNLIHRELTDDEVQNYFYDLHDQLIKAEIFKKAANKPTTSTATKSSFQEKWPMIKAVYFGSATTPARGVWNIYSVTI